MLTLSEDGKIYTAARRDSDTLASELEHLLHGYHDVNQIVLERIPVTYRVAKALVKVLRSNKHSWISLKIVDCWHSLDASEMKWLVEEGLCVVPSLFLQTTSHFPESQDTCCFFPIECISSSPLSLNAPVVQSLRICTHNFTQEFAEKLETHLATANTMLKSLTLSGSRRCGMFADKIASGFENNRSLEMIDLGDCQLDDKATQILMMALAGHPRLQKLDLSNNLWKKKTLHALAEVISLSSTLQRLDLSLQRFSVKTSILAPALARPNCPLKRLYVSNCDLADEEFVALVDALVPNATLEYLDASKNRRITDAALLHLAHQLPHLSLKYLNILKMNSDGSPEVLQAIEDGMRRNTHIIILRICYWRIVKHGRQIQYLANMNRAGRCLLVMPEDSENSTVPLGLWPLVFTRAWQLPYFCPLGFRDAKVDATYHLLRNSPALWNPY